MVAARAPDYDRPYYSRHHPQRTEHVVVSPPPTAPKQSGWLGKLVLMTATLAVAIVSVMLALPHLVAQDTHSALASDAPSDVAAMALVAPESIAPLDRPEHAETARAFLDRSTVSSARLAARDSRAIINGQLYRVGEVVNESLGLVFAGHDPDGEFLLFRDQGGQTYFLRLFQEG